MSKALYRKWRPMTFSDVVGQPQVTETLKKQIAGGRLSHAYLFSGTRGTGKTTCAKILAKAINCLDPRGGEPCNECAACRAINDGSAVDVSEIDAASNNKVDQIRALCSEAEYLPVELKYRVYIIDECHMLSLSPGSWSALLKTLEEPPAHVVFVLATTELNKVPPTILSRCQRYAFRRGSPRDIAARLSDIAAAEQIKLTEDGADALARLADGAFRDAISLLDQCSSAREGETLDEAAIFDELGLAGVDDSLEILGAVARGDAGRALELLDKLYAAGRDMSAFLGELCSALRDELILLTTNSPALLGGRYSAAALKGLGLSAATASAMLGDVVAAQSRLSRAGAARTEVELCLVRLCESAVGLPAAPPGDGARAQAGSQRSAPARVAPAGAQAQAPQGASAQVQAGVSAPSRSDASQSTSGQAQSSENRGAAQEITNRDASARAQTGVSQDMSARAQAGESQGAAQSSTTQSAAQEVANQGAAQAGADPLAGAAAQPIASEAAVDDAPPWDEPPVEAGAPDDAPPWDEIPPPEDAPPVEYEPEPPTASAHVRRASAAEQKPSGGDWWQQTLVSARAAMPISHYMQLSAQGTPKLDGDTLTIEAASEFSRKLLGERRVLDAVSAGASKALGRAITARCVLASEQEKGRDAFDELLEHGKKFDNFSAD